MKKLKQLLFIVMIVFAVFAFAACGSSEDTTDGGTGDSGTTDDGGTGDSGTTEKTLSSISVDASAATTEYYVGDTFSSDGIVVTAAYSDSSTATIAASDYTVDSTAYSSTTAGTYTITVTYQQKTATYSVTVQELTVTAISVDATAAKTSYVIYLDEAFSSDGIVVTATYNSGKTAELSADEYTIDSSAVRLTRRGNYTVSVAYGELSTSYSVSVAYGTVADSSFTIDATNVETLFYINKNIDTTGLTASVVINDTTIDVTDHVTVDKSGYNNAVADFYDIYVYFDYGTTYYDSYTVTVTDKVPMAGPYISVDGETQTVTYNGQIAVQITFELTSENPTVTLGSDLITGVTLHEILYTGTVDTPLSADEYTIEYYNSNTSDVVELSEDELTVGSGVYQICFYYVYTDPAYGVEYTLPCFVYVVVDNPVVSIALNSENTEAVYTQTAGTDKISSTWTYIATYANGDTATLTSSDVDVSIDTKTVAENATAIVSYTEATASGKEVTVETSVSYTITEVPTKEGVTSYTMTYAATVDSFATTWGENEDTESLVTITNSGISTWKNSSKSTSDGSVTYQYAVETKAYSSKAFKVNVAEGASNVTITVYFSHTSTAERTLYLGTVADSTTDGVIDSLAIGSTTASPSILSTIGGTNLSAGDYYIYSDGSTIHVYAIVVTYDVGPTTTDYTMTYAATVDSFATTWGSEEDTESTVVISDSGISTWKDSSKSTSDDSVTYQYAVETKSYSSKAFKIHIEDGATNVSITVYFSHTSTAERTLYLGTVADSTTDGVIDSLAIGSATEKPSTLSTLSGTDLSAGDYYVYSDGSTIHVYAIVVTYSI